MIAFPARSGAVCAALLLALATTGRARAQEFVSLSLSSSAVSFNMVAGRANNPGSTSITATTTWSLRPNRDSLSVYAYFNNAVAALNNGAGTNIASSHFQISNNGSAFQPLTNTVPFGGANAGLRLSSINILGNNKTGSRTDSMMFNIDLSTLPSLQPGLYTGSLIIQVQAI
jgi:hypothetical protein